MLNLSPASTIQIGAVTVAILFILGLGAVETVKLHTGWMGLGTRRISDTTPANKNTGIAEADED